MAGDSTPEFHLPNISVSPQLLERVQFSVSSRNAESKVCDTVAHLFGSPMVVSPRAVDWSYVTTGVVAMLRDKEIVKKKYMWTLQLCVYNIKHGVLVWKGRIPLACNYTLIEDTFHVMALDEGSGILGIMFQDAEIASKFYSTISEWITEGIREDKGKAPPQPPKVKFRKEMISYPCNFQHVQGSQAIDQCIEIEEIKAQILKSLANIKLKSSTFVDASKARNSKSKKKEPPKPSIAFNEIGVPAATIDEETTDGPESAQVRTNGDLSSSSSNQYQFQPTPPIPHTHSGTQLPQSYPGGGGSDNSQSSFNLGRLSPLDLEDEINQSFAFTSPPTDFSLPSTIKEMSP